jgi:hypothetical protein
LNDVLLTPEYVNADFISWSSVTWTDTKILC